MERAAANHIASCFPWKKAAGRLFSFFWRFRTDRIFKYIESEIPNGASALDIGAGSGMMGDLLMKKKNASVFLLDVIDWNISSLPITLFDGKRIPFLDKQFDIALLIDVVHHSEDEESLMEEALRVAKKVIVVEEQHEHGGGNILANIMDNLQFFLYGMPLGVHHRKSEHWLEFFLQYSSYARCVRKDIRHSVFILE